MPIIKHIIDNRTVSSKTKQKILTGNPAITGIEETPPEELLRSIARDLGATEQLPPGISIALFLASVSQRY